MGIRVLEHLIIGNNQYFSFADHGYVGRFLREYESVHGSPAAEIRERSWNAKPFLD